MGCKGYRTGCGGAREGGGEIRWENVRQEEGEIFFLSFICSVSLLRVGDPRGGSQFLCVWLSFILNVL